MKFSIIIPTFNEEEHLPQCLESLFSMNYPKLNYEVIIIDNGSSDETRTIARKFKVKLLRDDSKSVAGLRNLGATAANGNILAFIDADCVVSPQWLNAACKYENQTEIVAWGCPPGVPQEATWVQKTWYLVRRKKNKIADVDWLESMNLFVRRKDFIDIGGFNESLVTCEDVDFSYRLKPKGRVLSDDTVQVIHMGEADTVKNFYRKELWRGRSNLAGFFSHGFTIKELPSLSIPLYYGLFIPLMALLAGLIQQWNFLFLLLIFLVIPSFALILLVGKKDRLSIKEGFQLFCLSQVYFVARTIAVVKK